MQSKKIKDKLILKSDREPVRVGISIGDINGIGPEVIIKALRNNEMLMECTPIIYGSTKTMAFHKKAINDDLFNYQRVTDASDAKNKKINIIPCWNEVVNIQLGKAKEEGGKYAFLSLERATQDLAAGKIDVLVTAPISKETIHQAGFKFPGHTEYLADLSGAEDALMMMVSGELRVALVTSHIPLKQVIEDVTEQKVLDKIRELNKSLKKDFGIVKPRIAVLGLNPHAGEKGEMGSEESEKITPAIQKAMEEGIITFGPYPADGFFGSRQYSNFDGVLAMYHDQGLTGFKSLAFDDGVNFTAGLPIVRTSPDHGTAFDIAGKDEANEQSMRSAIYLAMDIFRKRKFIKEINENPLPKRKVREEKKSKYQ
ncbi:4-hydroxythreonine-4-phosphate dehydrogenase PdxA [Brumimicrobium aurantiacum]|uniref:4-hydroxythreonine-4-phosphate dehydrogenase PdxA n=1 Tax=Brumimicrobium aurantiacum TaxID=1737063 RepID=A0A3E1F229_9FLAO|nr:4-hydroxythreonine-4-phosphate dehydrogenase PdxA [Brumimicrobium aurantiacum]RFC55882.1 4-hydroxythreonine-4-phosphate dehydrogenase PdxA [Brumimicrobium aurantiacum]